MCVYLLVYVCIVLYVPITSQTFFFLLKDVCVVMVALRQGNRKQICTHMKGNKKNQDITRCYVYIETTFLDFKCLFRKQRLQQGTVVDIMYINQYWLMDYVSRYFVWVVYLFGMR